MAPRARSITDTTILDHACELLAGPGREAVTFAQVADRCGLAPPTLVQRFATREGMLKAAAHALVRQVTLAFAVPEPSPLTRLHAGSAAAVPWIRAAMSLGPETGADQICLELRKQISFALADAVEACELPHCDVAQLARTIQISIIGAVATARLEGGDPINQVRDAVDAHLSAFI